MEKNIYSRRLLIEKKEKRKTIFVKPGVYTFEHDFTILSYDLVSAPSTSMVGISSRGPKKELKEIKDYLEFEKAFGSPIGISSRGFGNVSGYT
jgi:hypothetical protein